MKYLQADSTLSRMRYLRWSDALRSAHSEQLLRERHRSHWRAAASALRDLSSVARRDCWRVNRRA